MTPAATPSPAAVPATVAGLTAWLSEQEYAVTAGDWHGHDGWAVKAVERVARDTPARALIHVGDFGVWFTLNGPKYLDMVNDAAEAHGVVLVIVLGNHDDRRELAAQFAANGNQPVRIRSHMWVVPSGWRWSMSGWEFVALAGAPSMNRPAGVRDGWWQAEEAITDAEVDAVVEGGPAHVLVCHDTPPLMIPAVSASVSRLPLGGFPAEAELEYAREGRQQVARAWYAVAPRLTVHGHYHAPGVAVGPGVTTLSLGMQDSLWNLALLDLGVHPDAVMDGDGPDIRWVAGINPPHT